MALVRPKLNATSADVFMVFEEYDLPNGIRNHVAAAPFQTLGGSGLIADLDIKSVDLGIRLWVSADAFLACRYYSEFDGEGKTLHA